MRGWLGYALRIVALAALLLAGVVALLFAHAAGRTDLFVGVCVLLLLVVVLARR